MIAYLRSILTVVLLSAIAVGMASCHKKTHSGQAADSLGNQDTYFSIIQFTQDQWNNFHGEPFVVVKTVTKDDKVDSSYIGADTLHWSSIFKTFFETDISDDKFKGHYNFSIFDDNSSGTRNIYYEAKDPDLFTRKLMISLDPSTNKILSIYIETSRKEGYTQVDQKLYYSVMKFIQMQRFEKTTSGPATKEVTEYRFML